MLCYSAYNPPLFLKNGLTMTVYTALWGKRYWEQTTSHLEPPYEEKVVMGAQGVPIFLFSSYTKKCS
jgi:uncharacterized protein